MFPWRVHQSEREPKLQNSLAVSRAIDMSQRRLVDAEKGEAIRAEGSEPSTQSRTRESESQLRTDDGINHNVNIKRSVKPRSQRNRKRPRSDILSNDDLEIDAKVIPLRFEGEEVVNGPPYLRLIEPYVYTFTSHAKARWIGRTVLDVYVTEFGSYPASYYETAIKEGRILVSDKKVDLTYKIKGPDILCHCVHRHEPAVAVDIDEPPYVRIVGETDTILAVDKPSTLPIHPCGGYHRNSLMPLLEPTYSKLYTIHRLDRLTSGLTILGKTSQEAQSWGKAIAQREHCEKIYLARVKGRFPEDIPDHVSKLKVESELPRFGEWDKLNARDLRQRHAYGYWISDSSGEVKPGSSLSDVASCATEIGRILNRMSDCTTTNEELYWLNLCCPVRVVEPKRGICESGQFADVQDEEYAKKVKAAQTSFKVVYYDSQLDCTVVMCRPETGRTHQIRLHLQHLGHPIANDPNYGGDLFFGNESGKAAFEKAKGQLNICAEEKKLLLTSETPATLAEVAKLATDASSIDREKESLSDLIRRTCVWCARSNDPTLEFLVRSPGIWLHALQYTVKTMDNKRHSFQTDVPKWARQANSSREYCSASPSINTDS